MSVANLTNLLLWCTVINFGILALWSVLMMLQHQWLHRLWSRWYRISPENFDTVSFAGIVLYKLLIILFNLVPYISLRIVG